MINKRRSVRQKTDTPIDCRLMTTGFDVCRMDGVMRNYSAIGTYIESRCGFSKGSLLMVRVVKYPDCTHDPGKDPASLRAHGLAEVKWVRRLEDRPAATGCYGLGLHYI